MKKYLIWLLICAFLVIGGWGNRESFPVAAWVSIVLGIFILLAPLVFVKQKKASIEQEEKTEYYAITKENVNTFAHDAQEFDYEYSDVGIYRPKEVDLPMPPIGAALEFEDDPENAYDADAIKAVWNGQTVGWLYRKGKREMIRDWIKRGDYYEAEVSENDPELKFWIGMDKG